MTTLFNPNNFPEMLTVPATRWYWVWLEGVGYVFPESSLEHFAEKGKYCNTFFSDEEMTGAQLIQRMLDTLDGPPTLERGYYRLVFTDTHARLGYEGKHQFIKLVPRMIKRESSANTLPMLTDGKEECTHCNGYGSSLKDPIGINTCTVCKGKGLVPKTTTGGV